MLIKSSCPRNLPRYLLRMRQLWVARLKISFSSKQPMSSNMRHSPESLRRKSRLVARAKKYSQSKPVALQSPRLTKLTRGWSSVIRRVRPSGSLLAMIATIFCQRRSRTSIHRLIHMCRPRNTKVTHTLGSSDKQGQKFLKTRSLSRSIHLRTSCRQITDNLPNHL